MYRVKHRLAQLERRSGASQEQILYLLNRIERKDKVDSATCSAVLEECGFLPGRFPIAWLDFTGIPEGLSTKELEVYVRTHAEAICSSGRKTQRSTDGKA